MTAYMPNANGKGKEEPVGRISVHEDTNGDGIYDTFSVFWDDVHQPRATALYKGGILYGGHEKLYFIENNNGKAGKKTLGDDHYATKGNVEHRTNGLLKPWTTGSTMLNLPADTEK